MKTIKLKLPTLASVCVGAVLLTTSLSVLRPHSAQVSALILNPPVSNDGGDVGSSQTPGGVGNGFLDAWAMTPVDRLVLVCDGCPKTSGGCHGKPAWRDYYKQNWERLTHSGVGRKRRFASAWNGWNLDPWSWSSWSPSSSPGTGGQGLPPSVCPSQTDQSAVYKLSSNFMGFPAEDVSAELGMNLPFFQFLLLEAVLSDTPPLVGEDSVVTASPATCPSRRQRLWQYLSLSQGQVTCWVLANFGDFVLYRECTTRTCQNSTGSGSSNEATTNTGGSFWSDWHSSSFWDSWSPQGGATSTAQSLRRGLCLVEEYRAVSLWAYCPTRPPGQRIVRDRIILPLACGCRSVACHPA